MKRRAFTLMELLVVVVIIGLLAALLFPVFAKAKQAAQKATCISNSRELALASLMYMQDHDDHLFPYGYWEGSTYRTWWGDLMTGKPDSGLIFPYTKSGQIRACPGAIGLDTGASYRYIMGYGMNFRIFYAYPPEYDTAEFRVASGQEAERPAETLFFADTAFWNSAANSCQGSHWLFGDSNTYHMQARHTGDVANVTWLDGHVSTAHLTYQNGKFDDSNAVDPATLKANNLGDFLKYPRENPFALVATERDQFYYLFRKPRGL